MPKLTIRAIRYGRKDRPLYRKGSLLKILFKDFVFFRLLPLLLKIECCIEHGKGVLVNLLQQIQVSYSNIQGTYNCMVTRSASARLQGGDRFNSRPKYAWLLCKSI